MSIERLMPKIILEKPEDLTIQWNGNSATLNATICYEIPIWGVKVNPASCQEQHLSRISYQYTSDSEFTLNLGFILEKQYFYLRSVVYFSL